MCVCMLFTFFFFFSSRRRHTRCALVTGVQTCALPISLAPDELAGHARVLFVVATYGDGEAPDFARTFARKLREAPPDLDGLEYAVLALGDTDYEESFCGFGRQRSEEHTSELQSLMRISYAVFCLKKKKKKIIYNIHQISNKHREENI